LPKPAPPPAAPSAPAKKDPSLPIGQCQPRYAMIGAPRVRGSDAEAQQKEVCLPGYLVSFNVGTQNPDWVIHRIQPDDLGSKAKRGNKFLHLNSVPNSPYAGDYADKAVPRDRGHQAPAADFGADQALMDLSFEMINMSPQVGLGFNRGQWRLLEEDVRAAVLCGGHKDIIVITGPIYGSSNTWVTSKSGRKILSPAAYYKILYDVDTGRAVGYRLENKPYVKTRLDTFIVPISQIEDETGIDFMPALTRRTQNQIETSKGAYWGHGQSCTNVGKD
jgi:endonuclease G